MSVPEIRVFKCVIALLLSAFEDPGIYRILLQDLASFRVISHFPTAVGVVVTTPNIVRTAEGKRDGTSLLLLMATNVLADSSNFSWPKSAALSFRMRLIFEKLAMTSSSEQGSGCELSPLLG